MRPRKQQRTIANVAKIWSMVLDGKRSGDIGSAIGISPQRVRMLCSAFGVPLPTSGNFRLAFVLPAANARVVFEIAKEAGMTNAEVLSLMVRCMTDGGVVETRRAMGKLLPRRGKPA